MEVISSGEGRELTLTLRGELDHHAAKEAMRQSKARRDARRAAGEDPAPLILESQRERADLQRLKQRLREDVEQAEKRYAELEAEIEAMRSERHRLSAELQMELFARFRMLNARGEEKDLCELFAQTPQHVPPAGAGECAAPKLLQYAYRNSLHPIAMAEFWWGDSPAGEVRRHGEFYPACTGKCKPILPFMLQGLDVEPTPLLEIRPPEPRVVWEDAGVQHIGVRNDDVAFRAREAALDRFRIAVVDKAVNFSISERRELAELR